MSHEAIFWSLPAFSMAVTSQPSLPNAYYDEIEPFHQNPGIIS